MDSFGFYYNKNYLKCDPVYLEYFNLTNPNASPEMLLDHLKNLINELFDDKTINSEYDPLLHHARIFPLVESKEYDTNFTRFMETLPSNTIHGYHFRYDRPHKIDGKDFVSEFHQLSPFFKKWHFQSVVVHPPSKKFSNFRRILKNFTNPTFIEDLISSKVVIAIENMLSSNAYFSDVRNLVQLREKLKDAYLKLGYPQIIDQIAFCFDTGHHLSFLNHNKINPNEDLERLKEFAQYIKVFHIHTNCGTQDDHLLIREHPLAIPPNKLVLGFSENQQELIQNSYRIMEWVNFCSKCKNIHYGREYLQEIDDYINISALKESIRWIK